MGGQTKVLVFTGAGIGVPLGLPTSTGFVEEVRATAEAVTNSVMRYLGGTTAEDIEWILATLESFQTEVSFTESLISQLVQGNQYAQNGEGHIRNNLNSFKSQAQREVKRIKKLIFEKLNGYDRTQASSLYKALMQELKNFYPSAAFSIVTTNYDLSFESSIEDIDSGWNDIGIKDFEYGFAQKYGRPIYDPARDLPWRNDVLEFIKIHGSLDWHRDARDQCSRSMSNTIPDNPDQMAILYPGYKGVPEIEPFVSLHGKFIRRLSEADVAVVIGFAFRDAYINSIFDNALRIKRDLKVYYFNPLAIEDHPSESMVRRFAQYSGFIHSKRGIELSDSPLGLSAVVASSEKVS